MRNRFDRFMKELLADALSAAGEARPVETAPEAQHVDLWFEPRGAPAPELGLLGRMAREPCLFESFCGTVSLDAVRECVRKQLGRYHELRRKSRALWKVPPNLWVLSNGVPRKTVVQLGFEQAKGWPVGVYQLQRGLRVYLIVRRELPKNLDTLLLRVTGSGRVLTEAMEEARRMPEASSERRMIKSHISILATKLQELSTIGPLTREEEEVLMSAQQLLEDMKAKARAEGQKEGDRRGRRKGREEGREEGARRVLRRIYEQRFGAMPAPVTEALARTVGLEILEQLADTCLKATREDVAKALGVKVH